MLPEAGLVIPPLHSYLWHPSCLTSGSLSTAQCTSIAWGEVRIGVHRGSCTFWAAWLGRGVRGDFNLSQPVVKMCVCACDNTQADSFSGYQCLELNTRWKLSIYAYFSMCSKICQWWNVCCICMLIDTPLLIINNLALTLVIIFPVDGANL